MILSSQILTQISKLLSLKDRQALRSYCHSLHPADLASALGEMPPSEIIDVLTHLDVETKAGIFPHFGAEEQVEIASLLTNERLAPSSRAWTPMTGSI